MKDLYKAIPDNDIDSLALKQGLSCFKKLSSEWKSLWGISELTNIPFSVFLVHIFVTTADPYGIVIYFVIQIFYAKETNIPVRWSKTWKCENFSSFMGIHHLRTKFWTTNSYQSPSFATCISDLIKHLAQNFSGGRSSF